MRLSTLGVKGRDFFLVLWAEGKGEVGKFCVSNLLSRFVLKQKKGRVGKDNILAEHTTLVEF